MGTSSASSASSQQATIDAALLVLKSMGLSPGDLLSAGSSNPTAAVDGSRHRSEQRRDIGA